jgi:hypothetical protein
MSTQIDVTLKPDQIDASALRLQWVGGFYPAGAVIALQLLHGRSDIIGEKLYNPADPEARAQLERLTKERACLIAGADVHHGEQARRELRALLDKAKRTLLIGGRLDWGRAVQEFQSVA